MINTDDNILDQPFDELELSEAFKIRGKAMGYCTLGDIIRTAPEVMLGKDGFTYNWLGELVTYLNDRKLLKLLQPPPGNDPG